MTDKVPHRSFTVRVSLPTYCEIAELARNDGASINHKVNQLLRLGMDKNVNLNEAIARLIGDALTGEPASV